MNIITIILISMVVGSVLTNIRYYFLLKKKPTIMLQTRHFKLTHFNGETADGEEFVYCPAGNIISWNVKDAKHKWCHFCKGFFGVKANSLLNDNEKHLRLK